MKIKLIQVVSSAEAISEFMKLQLNIRTAYKLNKINILISSEVAFYKQKHEELVIKYGEQTKENNYKVLEENMDVFNKEMGELNNTEIELEIENHQITLDEIPDELNIAPNLLSAVDFLVFKQ